MHIEKIYNITHYWENSLFGTLSEKQLEELTSTNITEEAALECFNRDNWWYPDSNNHYYSDYVPGWEINSITCSKPKFILFDSLDGVTQIIRQLDFIDPRNKKLRESQRVIYNPKTGFYKSLMMPRNDANPYQVSHPFYGTKLDYIRYSLGGYNNLFGSICFGDCFFYFRRLVPGIKIEKILKRNISIVYNYGESIKNPDYCRDYNGHVWMSLIIFKSFITGNSLFEILWDLGFKDNFYNSYSSTKGLDIGFIENHRQSFLISRKNGVNFGSIKTVFLWIDTIKLLEKYNMDIRNPKYIAKELKKTHDILVNRDRKRALEIRRENERNQRLTQEKLALEEKEKLTKEDEIYKVSKERYIKWCKEDGNIKIIPVQSASDCLKTGLELSNCCYSAGYYKDENSILLKIYVYGILKELAQVGIKDKVIHQCCGYQNKESEYHDRILNVLKQNIKDLP